jgi:hypothetical protein
MINFSKNKDCFITFCAKAGKINPLDYRESILTKNLFNVNNLDEESLNRGTGKTTSIVLLSLYDFYIKNNSCVIIHTSNGDLGYLRSIIIDILISLNSSYKNIFEYKYFYNEFILTNLNSKICLRHSLEMAMFEYSSLPTDYSDYFNKKIIKD